MPDAVSQKPWPQSYPNQGDFHVVQCRVRKLAGSRSLRDRRSVTDPSGVQLTSIRLAWGCLLWFSSLLCADDLVVRSYPIGAFNSALEGQWQGTTVGSNGRVYFGVSSHTFGQGAAFFSFDPATQELAQLVPDLSRLCGEDPHEHPPQGKIHSEIVEYRHHLWFGTHLAIYDSNTRSNYTGGHLVSYDLDAGQFRDWGILRTNQSIYSGLALDAARGWLYVFTCPSIGNPFFYADEPALAGEGCHLFRVDLNDGSRLDLGIVAPGGDACLYLLVDAAGDCWFMPLGSGELKRVRHDAIEVERVAPTGTQSLWSYVIPNPGSKTPLLARGLRGQQRELLRFDPSRPFDTAFSSLGIISNFYVMAKAASRLYWTDSDTPGVSSERLLSLSVDAANLESVEIHGALIDQDGRRPMRLGGVTSDGHGHVYLVGDWFKRADEPGSIRNGEERPTVMRFAEVYLPALDDTLRLEALGLDSEGHLRLRARGLERVGYSLEVSSDLQVWERRLTLFGLKPVIEFVEPGSPVGPTGARFFRIVGPR